MRTSLNDDGAAPGLDNESRHQNLFCWRSEFGPSKITSLSFPSFTTAKRIPGQAACHGPVEEKQERRGRRMPNDVIEGENELRNIVQEQYQLAEQIQALQQHIHDDETWLRSNPPATVGYQEVLKERVLATWVICSTTCRFTSMSSTVDMVLAPCQS